MRSVLCTLAGLVLWACASPFPAAVPEQLLWRPAAAPDAAAQLRIEPARLAVRTGEAVTLRVRGLLARRAHCSGAQMIGSDGTLELAARSTPGVSDVVCRVAELQASAQVTFTRARVLPNADPYAGGIVLFKLRRTPTDATNPVGRRATGLRSLDALLEIFGAHVFPAFPFGRGNTDDRVGLGRWVVIELPENVNFYQAVALLRADRNVYPESYLPEDADYLRVRGTGTWPLAFEKPREGASPSHLKPVSARDPIPPAMSSWDLDAIGAPLAWRTVQGAGTGVAVIDTGVDMNHVSLSDSIRAKPGERPGIDADGNGIAGDWAGVNFAHLAIAHGEGGPRLALGLLSNVSDWDTVSPGTRPQAWGHGTAIAALAAGSGGVAGRFGVAPQAWVIPVDVQENLRVTQSRLLESDPRMRLLPMTPASFAPLRSPVWAHAVGVAYAVRERVRVLTCAWPPMQPSWILHDALSYAEDNCVLAVCALEDADSASVSSYIGSGDVYDAWTGEVRREFLARPPRSTLWVDGLQERAVSVQAPEPELRVRLRSSSAATPLRSAASDPRNDMRPLPDHRSAEFTRPGAAAGLVAGAALLVSARRPDLEPLAVRNALLEGARPHKSDKLLWVPGALGVAERQPRGACVLPTEPESAAQAWWRRLRIRVSHRGPGDETSVPVAPPGRR